MDEETRSRARAWFSQDKDFVAQQLQRFLFSLWLTLVFLLCFTHLSFASSNQGTSRTWPLPTHASPFQFCSCPSPPPSRPPFSKKEKNHEQQEAKNFCMQSGECFSGTLPQDAPELGTRVFLNFLRTLFSHADSDVVDEKTKSFSIPWRLCLRALCLQVVLAACSPLYFHESHHSLRLRLRLCVSLCVHAVRCWQIRGLFAAPACPRQVPGGEDPRLEGS